MKLDVPLLIQHLRSPEKSGTDGAHYLVEHLVKPWIDGKRPNLSDLDYQAFQLDDFNSAYEKWQFYFDFEHSDFCKTCRGILLIPPCPQKSKSFF